LEVIKQICQNDNLPNNIEKHLTFDTEFAEKIILFDILQCTCLKPKTNIGQVLKELIINNYQLILKNRIWMNSDHQLLYLEAANYVDTLSLFGKAINNTKK
jgi:hypothetical protein